MTTESPRVIAAFFDLDRTLIEGSSAFVFGRAARAAGHVKASEFVVDALKALRFKVTGSTDNSSVDVRERMLTAVRGMKQSDMLALNESVLPELLNLIRPEARERLEHHQQSGHETYIISASPIEIVQPLAHALDMTAGIGTRGEVVDGIYTGKLDGPFCYAEGKAEAIRSIAFERNIDLSASYSYSDSVSDLPMMELTGHAIAVNPDSEMRRSAQERGWTILSFSKRSNAVIRRTSFGVGAVLFGLTMYALGVKRSHN